VTYETIRHRCQTFGPDYARRLGRRRGRMGDTWYLDERFVNIQGRRQYLWRSVDQDGDVIDMLVQSRRNRWAATRFFRKLLKGQGRLPLRLITDKLLSYKAAHRAAKPEVHALSIRANAQGPFAGTHRDNPRCDRQRSRTMGAVGAAARRITRLPLTSGRPLISAIVPPAGNVSTMPASSQTPSRPFPRNSGQSVAPMLALAAVRQTRINPTVFFMPVLFLHDVVDSSLTAWHPRRPSCTSGIFSGRRLRRRLHRIGLTTYTED